MDTEINNPVDRTLIVVIQAAGPKRGKWERSSRWARWRRQPVPLHRLTGKQAAWKPEYQIIRNSEERYSAQQYHGEWDHSDSYIL